MTDHSHTSGSLPEMPCEELVEVVTAYLDDALSDVDRQRFEGHLAICTECVAYVEQIRATIVMTGRAGAQAGPLPSDLREGLRHAFQNWSP
jgi:anti-sigma factor RsiW